MANEIFSYIFPQPKQIRFRNLPNGRIAFGIYIERRLLNGTVINGGGIFVCDDDRRRVVLDGHMPFQGQPHGGLFKELNRIGNMPVEELKSFINNHDKCRNEYRSEPRRQAPPEPDRSRSRGLAPIIEAPDYDEEEYFSSIYSDPLGEELCMEVHTGFQAYAPAHETA